MRRMEELRDPTVDHSWLYRLDSATGPVLRDDDFTIALQLRLGADIVAESYTCPECDAPVDPKLSHSSCCAKAERTKGHNVIVRTIFDRMTAVDGGATLEARGLVEGEPGARPADIFTTAAVPNRDAAIDVTIVSQEAGHTNGDCVATAHAGKFARYRAAVDEWGPQGIVLQPMVWSHEGRAHPDVERIMVHVASTAARRTGGSAAAIIRRWKSDLGVALATRRARMAKRCLPKATWRSEYVVFGDVDPDPGPAGEAWGDVGGYVGLDDVTPDEMPTG